MLCLTVKFLISQSDFDFCACFADLHVSDIISLQYLANGHMNQKILFLHLCKVVK